MERNEEQVKKYIVKLYEGGVAITRHPPVVIHTSAVSVRDAVNRVIKDYPGSIVTYCQEE